MSIRRELCDQLNVLDPANRYTPGARQTIQYGPIGGSIFQMRFMSTSQARCLYRELHPASDTPTAQEAK